MKQIKSGSYIEQRLPPRLVEGLYKLAKKYQKKDIRLFVFGSFARSEDRQTSDLDLGVQWIGKHSAQTFVELCEDVRELPTIRKIDVVDMEYVNEFFRNKAISEGIIL